VAGSLLTPECRKSSPLLHDFWPASFQHGASCCLANPDVISKLNVLKQRNWMNVFMVLQRLLVTHSQGQPTTLEKREYKKALGFLNRRVKLARSKLAWENLLNWRWRGDW
jgi:hypothetical protein